MRAPAPVVALIVATLTVFAFGPSLRAAPDNVAKLRQVYSSMGDFQGTGIGLCPAEAPDARATDLSISVSDAGDGCPAMVDIGLLCAEADLAGALELVRTEAHSCSRQRLMTHVEARLLYQLGREAEAIQRWSTLRSGPAFTLGAASRFITERDYDQASLILRGLEGSSRRFWSAGDLRLFHELRGDVAYREKRWSDAIEEYETSLSYGPGNGENHLFIADSLHALGESEAALERVDGALDIVPPTQVVVRGMAYERRGALLEELGNRHGALDALLRAYDLYRASSRVSEQRIDQIREKISRLEATGTSP